MKNVILTKINEVISYKDLRVEFSELKKPFLVILSFLKTSDFFSTFNISFYRKTNGEDEEIVEKALTEGQILASCELLENLSVEGDEVVGITNVYFE